VCVSVFECVCVCVSECKCECVRAREMGKEVEIQKIKKANKKI